MGRPSVQEQELVLYQVQKGSQQGPATFASIQEHQFHWSIYSKIYARTYQKQAALY